MTRTYEVYLPVAVTVEVDDDGTITAGDGAVDYDGAPWMYVDREPNIWPSDAEEHDIGWLRATNYEYDDEDNDPHQKDLAAIEDAASAAVDQAFRMMRATS